jgi:threonine dehydrogenase-like Zn-dependent dehydrogenase
MELTGGEGAHAVIDTISGTSSMEAAHACVRAGGTIATLGMDHFMGKVPTVNWIDQWLRNVTIAGGYVPGGHYLPTLLQLAEQGRVEPSAMLSHHLPLEQAPEGYRLMDERAEGVIKVALRPGG